MTYICRRCGNVFEEEDAALAKIDLGDRIPSYDEIYACPKCRSTNISEAIMCSVCGEYRTVYDMELGGVCTECYDKAKTNYKVCKNASIGMHSAVPVNTLVATILDPADINAILFDFIEKNGVETKEACKIFAEYHEEEILDELKREVKK